MRRDPRHSIRFSPFLGPFSAPLDWLLPVYSQRVQPRDGGIDFTSVLQGHSTGQSKKVDKEMAKLLDEIDVRFRKDEPPSVKDRRILR